jgi:flagellin-like hook-associated protein FlgL
MAEEMTKYSKSQILLQAGQSMLAQAAHAPENILQLLG